MSEEANEAIDLLKFYEGFFKNIGHEEEVKSIESVINCIEKLQKENEELRQNYDIATTKIEELRKKLSLKCFDVNVVYNDYLEKLRKFKSNSIPKDKIREKLSHYEGLKKSEFQKHFEETGLPGNDFVDAVLAISRISLLKELLEEG